MISDWPRPCAIQMDRYGAPDVLRYVRVDLKPIAPTDIRIRMRCAAVNHTDLEIRAGNWPIRHSEPFPYTPGVEVIGVVEEVGSGVALWRHGDLVISMMQGLGGVRAERAGAYANYVTVAADSAAPVPHTINPEAMSAVGLAGVTAYWGLRRIGDLGGKDILITGAAGGVGSAAIAVARAQGATVTGLVSRPEHVAYVEALGAEKAIVALKGSRPDLGPRSFDGVLDTVAGALFRSLVTSLRPHGTLSVVGAVAGGEVEFDAWNLITPLTLTGYSTETLDGDALREAIASLAAGIENGTIGVPDNALMSLRDAAQAHLLIEDGGSQRRIVLVP